MNRLFKCISAAALSALLLAVSVFPAFAASAKTGDTIEVRVSIEGEDRMGSATVEITYDKDKLDFLSDETLEGTGLSNPNEPGILLWAAMFDANGVDYTKKTDVYTSVFIAKADIDSVENLIEFKVRDAYRIGASGIEAADMSKITCTIALEGANTGSESEITSEAETSSAQSVSSTISDNGAQTSSLTSSTSSVTSRASSNTSTAVSSNTASAANTSSAASSVVSSSKNEKSAETDTAKESDTEKAAEIETEEDTAADILEIAPLVDDSEFASVPPIKTDNDSVSSVADSRGAFPKAAIIGIAVCIAVAVAGGVALMAKRKN